jgi:anti-sigma factor RsiW
MRTIGILTCREFTGIATDYLEAQLSPWVRLQVWVHLGWCRRCQAYLRQLRQTIATLARLPRRRPEGATRDTLLRRFEVAHPERPGSGG